MPELRGNESGVPSPRRAGSKPVNARAADHRESFRVPSLRRLALRGLRAQALGNSPTRSDQRVPCSALVPGDAVLREDTSQLAVPPVDASREDAPGSCSRAVEADCLAFSSKSCGFAEITGYANSVPPPAAVWPIVARFTAGIPAIITRRRLSPSRFFGRTIRAAIHLG